MNYQVLIRWLVGLILVSGIFGVVLSYSLYRLACKLRNIKYRKTIGPLTGIIERFFFTIIVAINIGGAGTAMVGWIVFKNSTLWANFEKKEPEQLYISIISSIGSMLIAIIGAQICNGAIQSIFI